LEMTKKTTTLYLDAEPYQELKKLVYPTPISQEVDRLIQARLAELRGEEPETFNAEEYETLKATHQRYVRLLDRLEKQLKKHKAYAPIYNGYETLIGRTLLNTTNLCLRGPTKTTHITIAES